MQVTSQISEIRKHRWQDSSLTWGLTPTMGFLHKGHLSLIRQARQENDRVGVSIFVNPIQFNNPDDLSVYPHDIERDLALLEAEGVDLVWAPSPEIVYPKGFQTYVDVEDLSRYLEGAARPGHFRGVTTVVAKLFNIFQPHRAYFGQKDAQQVAVIKRMVQDLNFNLDVVVCPLIRETDGLAISSRNINLLPVARREATSLYQSLLAAQEAFNAGQRDTGQLKQTMLDILETTERLRVDYISVAHLETLEELEIIENRALVSLAVFADKVRLIDNIVLEKETS